MSKRYADHMPCNLWHGTSRVLFWLSPNYRSLRPPRCSASCEGPLGCGLSKGAGPRCAGPCPTAGGCWCGGAKSGDSSKRVIWAGSLPSRQCNHQCWTTMFYCVTLVRCWAPRGLRLAESLGRYSGMTPWPASVLKCHRRSRASRLLSACCRASCSRSEESVKTGM